MQTFADLVASRKAWLADVLTPWCRQAALADLRRAELEWVDIAGKVDPEKTLWYWAWSRFPELVNADLMAIDEARRVTVVLRDGRRFTGYPDSRRSKQGQLDHRDARSGSARGAPMRTDRFRSTRSRRSRRG